MADSHGLSMIDTLQNRVAAWRRRSRNGPAAASFRVVYDGSTIAHLDAVRDRSTLDEELAAAGWELSQNLQRAVTVDVLAFDANEQELSRMQVRITPQISTPVTGDSASVIKVLIEAHQQQSKLIIDMLGAVTAQMRESSQIAVELARGANVRVREAEAEAHAATATIRDAIDLARDNATPRRTPGERGLDILESFIGGKLREIGAPSSPAAPVAPVAPVAEVVEAAAVEVVQ